jgi:hypothetical protein
MEVEMVAPGNKDAHRHSMSGLKVEETSKWGAKAAVERCGPLKQVDMKPPGTCYPQFKQDQRLGKHYDHANDWVRGGGERAENKPGYVHGYKGKK